LLEVSALEEVIGGGRSAAPAETKVLWFPESRIISFNHLKS
jgi:hypothetical protein